MTHPLYKSPRRRLPLFHPALLLLLAALTATSFGCGPSTTSQSKAGNSVAELSAMLPNLKSLEMVSCSYILKMTTQSTRLPSPSDTQTELVGSLTLSKAAAESLKSDYKWTPVPRSAIPADLLAIIPAGQVMTCAKLNESFSANSNLAQGCVAKPAAEDWKHLYVLATDRDHPLKQHTRRASAG